MSEAICITAGTFGRIALVDLDHSLVRHAHSHPHILAKVGGADSSFGVDGKTISLTDDNFIAIDAWIPHIYSHSRGQPATRLLAIYIHPSWLARFPALSAAFHTVAASFDAGPARSRPIRDAFLALSGAMTSDRSNAALHEALVTALATRIEERLVPANNEPTGTPERKWENAADWRIRKAINRLSDVTNHVSRIDDLVEEAGMSRANFFRRFEDCTGVSPGLFQNVIRIERAYYLASHTDMNMGAIAQSLGFTNQAHFTRFFRNHAAVAPTRFRQALSTPRH